ncbi:MAG: N-acetylmuramoyl-L-alanine amidase [Rubrivivax sp.]|nr:N-acetylmuramoyl-L-alanine amidase [Rubrivivax sp.]
MDALRSLAAALLAACGAAAWAAPPPLTVLAPTASALRTERDVVHVLARTEPGAIATIAGTEVPVYATGVFVRDGVPLAPGRNTLRVEVRNAAGEATGVDVEIERVAPAPQPMLPLDRLVIDPASVHPRSTWRLAEGEAVDVAFRGTPGAVAEARLHASDPWQRLIERTASPGLYVGRLVLRGRADREPEPVQVRLSVKPQMKRWPNGRPIRQASERSTLARSAGAVGLWRSDVRRLYTVNAGGTDLTWGVHEVRLGGPNLAEVGRGTLLAVTGQQGERLRVQLTPDTIAWAPLAALEPAAPGTTLPRPVITSLSVAASADGRGDTVTLAWPATLPASIEPATSAAGRPALDVELYGTHHATTWITHRANRTLVREVTVTATGRDRVRMRIELERAPLWGWSVERDGAAMHVTVRPPPRIDAASPLAGLIVAVEAGHGGPTNLGAVGATGTPEKDINRATADALRRELEAAGARVVDIRVGDENPTPRERAQRVSASPAQLFVSVHANSTDPSRGYLRTGGTSTYYKHAAGRDLAAAIQRRLLEATALPDYGLVGNFNYAPIRLVTAMPAVLVEQAFVSNPAEEAQLLDPAFRVRLAQAVRAGLEDHLRALPR